MVCIFAEGALTRNGMLRRVPRRFRADRQGQRLSDHPGLHRRRLGEHPLLCPRPAPLPAPPAFSPYRVTILFGTPMPATSTALEVRQAVMELSCDCFDSRKPRRKPLE